MSVNDILIVWLALLTAGQALQWINGARWTKELRERLPQLDYKAELQLLQSTVTRDILKRNADLEHRLIVLLQRLEADPMAHDKHWTEITALKNLLK